MDQVAEDPTGDRSRGVADRQPSLRERHHSTVQALALSGVLQCPVCCEEVAHSGSDTEWGMLGLPGPEGPLFGKTIKSRSEVSVFVHDRCLVAGADDAAHEGLTWQLRGRWSNS